jgi:hypothetical protein
MEEKMCMVRNVSSNYTTSDLAREITDPPAGAIVRSWARVPQMGLALHQLTGGGADPEKTRKVEKPN